MAQEATIAQLRTQNEELLQRARCTATEAKKSADDAVMCRWELQEATVALKDAKAQLATVESEGGSKVGRSCNHVGFP